MEDAPADRDRRRALRAIAAAASLVALRAGGAFAAELPRWFDPARDASRDLAAALAIARATRRRVLVDVGGDWCVWCRIMERFFDANAELERLRDKWYVLLRVNWSPENRNEALLAHWPKIDGYPHFFVLDANGRLLRSQSTAPFEAGKGYDPAAMRAFLVRWAPDSPPTA